ncbi:Peptide transporter PTR3-A [Apostasia shenzhenica]|uniref:Peptide transporter PTR3-A n=1 Tax=Apostasia shenzhenica TaxID=1088818 RepID=A0A2I0A993_9ASPA|nr:Peptide transporter PTR3-A [Apostasia shenzhenica]
MEAGEGDYTKDGTIDIRGNPVLRHKRGGRKACSFIVVYEVFERMAFYGISSNLVLYLTNKLHEGTVSSSNNVTNWVGTIWMTPILGAYIADAHLGRYWTFIIASVIYFLYCPPASLIGFVTMSMLVSIVLYDRYFVPFARRLTGNPRGISLLQRMGVGFVIHIAIMLIASFTERRRLAVARDRGVAESGATVPLTIFILLPQFILMGIADAFLEVAKIEFFYDQAPEGMKSLGTSYAMTNIGVGNFLSSFLLKTTEKVTRRRSGGRGGWILNNLNKSHLDYYYAFLAVLCVINFVFFLIVSRSYVYKAEAKFVEEQEAGEQKQAPPYKEDGDLASPHR